MGGCFSDVSGGKEAVGGDGGGAGGHNLQYQRGLSSNVVVSSSSTAVTDEAVDHFYLSKGLQPLYTRIENALRQQRFVREVTLQYNLCNEPWIKYSIIAIAEKGLKKPLFTSARLKKGEVLYLESPTQRFELCFNGEKMVKSGNETDTNGVDSDNNNNNNNSNNNMMDVFRWSLCKKPLPQDAYVLHWHPFAA